MKALVLGSMLVSSAKGATDDTGDESDQTPLVVTGAILMALGAIYAGQVLYSATDHCLRRLRVPQERARLSPAGCSDSGVSSSDESVLVVSEDEMASSSAGQRGESARTSSKRSTRQSGTSSAIGAVSKRSSSRSGTGSALGAPAQSLSSRSGTCSALGASTQSSSSQSGSASAAGSISSSIQGGVAERSTSLRMRTPSGTNEALSAGQPAESADVAAAAQSIGALQSSGIGDVGRGKGTKGSKISNPWNSFQHEHKGKGLNSTAMSKLYKGQEL